MPLALALSAAAATAAHAAPGNAPGPFVSEIHYDNAGVDEGEGIELSAPAGFDLAGWRLFLYSGATGSLYRVLPLYGVVGLERDGWGAAAFGLPENGLQNGPDGIALVSPAGDVVEWLAYEGTFVAADGPAAGRQAVDIGVAESRYTPIGQSLQRAGLGTHPGELVWLEPQPASPGRLNATLSLGGAWPDVAIPALQGAGHTSPFAGRGVRTRGVVTLARSEGFHLQDATGDGDPATSDAVFAYTSLLAPPAFARGDAVGVDAVVLELAGGGPAAHEATTTELVVVGLTALETGGAALPAPVVLGAAGRIPPAETLDDDALASFEPTRDGLDFWESLEGMRVRLPDARATDATSYFGETWAVTDGGRQATGRDARGALVASPTDANPERIRVYDDPALTQGGAGDAQIGDHLGDVVGVVDYAFGAYEVVATEPFATTPSPAVPAPPPPAAGDGRLVVATYNVRNLHAGSGARIDRIGEQIARALGAPHVVALQEIQDDDGPVDSGNVDARETAARLVDAIARAAGPDYAYVDLPPVDGADGGQPGGNIRVAFLVDPARVGLDVAATIRIVDRDSADGDAFFASRKPLVLELAFGGRRIVLVNVHLSSRLGSSAAFGTLQPPRVGGATARLEQARVVAAFADGVVEDDPDALVLVLGDFNEAAYEPAVAHFDTERPARLRSLAEGLAPEERYSHVFDGEARLLDHVLASPEVHAHAVARVVHVNTGLLDAASDHDPLLARIDVVALPESRALPSGASALFALAVLARRSPRR